MVCCEDFEKVGAETRPLGPKKFFFFIFLHSLCHFHSARHVCAYHSVFLWASHLFWVSIYHVG